MRILILNKRINRSAIIKSSDRELLLLEIKLEEKENRIKKLEGITGMFRKLGG